MASPRRRDCPSSAHPLFRRCRAAPDRGVPPWRAAYRDLRHLQSQGRSAFGRTVARRIRHLPMARLGIQCGYGKGTGWLRRRASPGLCPGRTARWSLCPDSAHRAAQAAEAQAQSSAGGASERARSPLSCLGDLDDGDGRGKPAFFDLGRALGPRERAGAGIGRRHAAHQPAVAGSMLTFWSELGFVFPPFPFIAHSRGWDAEDMQNNVRQVKASDALREASRELVERAVDFWTVLDKNRAMLDKPMERAGRKANPLGEVEEAIV